MTMNDTNSIMSTVVITLAASLASAASATVEDAIDVFGPLEGSFGEVGIGRVVDVAAGRYHALILTEDGSVRAAGWNGPFDPDTGDPCGQCDPPAELFEIRALAAGTRHSMAMQSDGSVVCWGCDEAACDVPPDLAGDQGAPRDPAVAIAAGDGFSLALLESGQVLCWGGGGSGIQCEIPADAKDPANPVVGILASGDVGVAILADNTFVHWGGIIYAPPSGIPDGAVIADAVLSPQFDSEFPMYASIGFLLADGRYIDAAGVLDFDEDNPIQGIFPGPSTVIVRSDGSWTLRGSQLQGTIPLPGDMGFPRPPVSMATGGRHYLITIPIPADCDDNGVPDHEEIAQNPGLDCDGDGRLDSCREDSHWFETGVIVAEGVDLDLADVPLSDDSVRVSVEAEGDLDAVDEFLRFAWNGVPVATAFEQAGSPEPCEAGTDAFEIAPRIWNASDRNGRRILAVSPSLPVDPAACEESRFAITFAIEAVTPYRDCNGNGIDDDCEIADGLAPDVDGDRNPDECQPDCDGDGQPDAWAIFEGLVADCNANGIPDGCEQDRPGDLDGDGCVGPADLGILLSLWGTSNPGCGDLDGDGRVEGGDLGILLVNWNCP